ncbi:MAG: hypothetical protein WCR52_17145 [Bacteroidota bacterium]
MSKKLFLLPMLLGALMMFAPSCGTTDKCEKKVCGNGTCLDGTCDCEAGYEYDADGNCNVKVQDKFVGTYTIHDECDSGTDDYNGSISLNTDLTKVGLNKVWNLFQNPTIATITGTSLTIAKQKPDPIDPNHPEYAYWVEGKGTIATVGTKSVITLMITVTKETTATPSSIISTDHCTTTWTKN